MPSAERGDALRGRTVGLLQARHGQELAALIERHGGVAVRAPCLRERPAADPAAVEAAIRLATDHALDMAVFQTGCGTAALFGAAVQAGLYQRLTGRLATAVVVARGPKPLAVLHRHGVPVDRRTREPHTTAQVMEVLGDDLGGRTVLVQHYGSDNAPLVGHIRGAGAVLVEVRPYEWEAPPDPEPVLHLLDRLAAGEIDVTAFTSAAQVRVLFDIAAGHGVADLLPRWLAENTVVAAVGPVCAQALAERGVRVRIQPQRPKMVPLVLAICDHVAHTVEV